MKLPSNFYPLSVFHCTWVEPRHIKRPIRSFLNESNGAFYFYNHGLLKDYEVIEEKRKEDLNMSDILITLPDGSQKSLPVNSTAEDVARTIGKGLQKAGIAARFNGELVDYRRPLTEDGTIDIITKDSDEALEILRHSAAHIMAQAIKRLHPDVHFGVGPAIENGFYYDTDMEEQLQEEELPKIEKEMMEIVKANYPFERRVVSREEALEIFKTDPYKVELIKDLPEDEEISIYTQGDFTDL